MLFAEQNGIRNAEKIIGQVATAIMQFRTIATRNGVKNEWIGCVEECLMTHLQEWGFVEIQQGKQEWISQNGQHVTNIYLEQAYKGNIHLYATVNGIARKWVIRPSMAEYKLISKMGSANVPQEMLCAWIEQRLQ
jgi:serine/threonine-protein kinase HipA